MAQGRGWRQAGVNSLEPRAWSGMGTWACLKLTLSLSQRNPHRSLTIPPLPQALLRMQRGHVRPLAALSTYWLTQSSLVVTRSHLMINSSLFYQKLISVSGTKPLWNVIYSHRATQSLTSPGCLFRDCDFLRVKWDRAKKLLCQSLLSVHWEQHFVSYTLLGQKPIRDMTQEEHSHPFRQVERQKADYLERCVDCGVNDDGASLYIINWFRWGFEYNPPPDREKMCNRNMTSDTEDGHTEAWLTM